MSLRPIIHGRNFVETLILTLTQYELVSPTLEVREFVTQRLEEELCGLAYSYPIIRNIYKATVLEILKEMFPELPSPELHGCFIYEKVLEWLKNHQHHILGPRAEFMPEPDVEKELRRIAIKVVRTAVMSAFYRCSMVSLRA